MELADQYTLKFVALLLIFAVAVAGGLAALGAQRSERRDVLFSLGSALAAGIFLGAGLIHLLPDGLEALTRYFGGLDFPLGFLIATLGFLLVLYFEMVYLAGRHGPDTASGPGRHRLCACRHPIDSLDPCRRGARHRGHAGRLGRDLSRHHRS
jgi:hypothetical protein